MIFDTHAHYDDPRFDADRDDLLSELFTSKGVCGIINAASSYESLEQVLSLAGRFPRVYAAVGIHPENAGALPRSWLADVEAAALSGKAVAIGEIGLDYHWLDACPKPCQKTVFKAQLELADRLGLPVIIHSREAHGDILSILSEYRPAGVVHCFSGSLETAREIIRLGMYIGIGGAVTFKNARNIIAVAGEIPLERLLLETDAPYMAPEPFRGKRNDSSLIPFAAEKIASVRGVSACEILSAANQNAARLFGIPPREDKDVV